MENKVLVTGAAGFIGYHLCKKLINSGYDVIGVDNFCDYYDPSLKADRISKLQSPNFQCIDLDISDREAMDELFTVQKFESVVNLAAQAGVRLSLVDPYPYISSNLVGFGNILECSRRHQIKHLVYASSSSVYGDRKDPVHIASTPVDHPISLYAATKRSNELMAHSYSHLFNLPTTGLRFFSVYGPWGRPDAAYFIFTKAIEEGKPISLFNHGDMLRDFTYVDDIVEGVKRTLEHIPTPDQQSKSPDRSPSAPYRVYNIGNDTPVRLLDFVSILEELVGKRAIIEMKPMQPGDVPNSRADVKDLREDVGFSPDTDIRYGLEQFVNWYKEYYLRVAQ